MTDNEIFDIVLLLAFMGCATFATFKIARSSGSIWRKGGLYLVYGVALTILFGLPKGVGFLLLCPILIVIYTFISSRNTVGVIPENVAIMSANAFLQTAQEMGFAAQRPFNDNPWVIAMPLAIPNNQGITVGYADFTSNRLMLVIKPFGNETESAPQVQDFRVETFLPSLFNLLEKYGHKKKEGETTYHRKIDNIETEIEKSKSPEQLGVDHAKGFFFDLEIGEPYSKDDISEYVCERHPGRGKQVAKVIFDELNARLDSGILTIQKDNEGEEFYVHRDCIADFQEWVESK